MMTRLRDWTAVLSLFVIFAVGCGTPAPTRTAAEIDRGKQAVTTVLEAWRKGEPTDKLKLGTDPIVFSEDFRRTHSLTEFTIGASSVPDVRTIQYSVTLKLKDKAGKLDTREVIYLVDPSTPIRVTRDPYN